MPFDAQGLWWPPFQKLYTQLETLKLEPTAVSADALKATLAEYEPWLARGVAGFLPPSEASRRALESEPSLSIGAKKLPVEAGLRGAAADISSTLHLDEVQAYILLRRWVTKAGAQALLPAGGAGAAAAASLSPDQRVEVVQLYFAERLYLLKSIEGLLWEGERAGDSPLLDVIEGTLSNLLGSNLEEATFQALKSNLEAAAGGAASTTTSAAPMAIAAFGGVGSGSAAAAAAAVGEARAHAAAVERCSLLHILILIYYHPRKQCTPDRFLDLANLFHTRLFTTAAMSRSAAGGNGGSQGDGGGELSPAQLSVKLATLLLLEMLDVDKALAALASQQAVDETAYVFAGQSVRGQVNAELASWWPSASAAHSPVLLAWAAVLCLAAKSADGDSQSSIGLEYAAHAAKAYATDVLGTLRQLTCHAGLQPSAAEMFNNIVLSTMAAAFCAFNFSPAALPMPQADQVVATLANLFRDQPGLCDSFWAGDRLTDEPLRHFLDDTRSLYPALPTHLYTLLAALSSTADSAASANAYLAQLPGLACLHVLPDAAIEEGCNDEKDVYARDAIPLPGARALTLPQGVQGEVVPLPEGLSPTDSLWTVPAGEDVEAVSLVRWHLALPDGVGQWILLARLSEALALVQRRLPGSPCTPAATAHTAAALAELAAALQLLATFCLRNPHTAMELLHVEVPSGTLEAGQRGLDLLSMACQAVATLAQLAEPPTAIIADCLSVCTALAEGIPGRVATELLSLCGISPSLSAAAAGRLAGQEVDAPLLRRLVAAECGQGRYPATHAFLRLLTVLISAAAPAPALQVLVVWVLQRVLAEHRSWRYGLRSERWRLAGLSLRLVRQALLSGPTPVSSEASPAAAATATAAAAAADGAAASGFENGGSTIAAAVEAVLCYDVGLTACLLSALPYHAQQLERTGTGARGEDEVAAVEDCVIEWHRLLPILLPPGTPSARLSPAAFFRPCPAVAAAMGAGVGQAPASAAAVLLSYVSYPYFGSAERALVLRSMHCLAVASYSASPGAVFAVLLPQESGDSGVASAARGAIAAAFSPQAAAAQPALLAAACDALVAAVQCHPSLLDALLFPCALEQALLDKENTSSNATASLPAPGDAPGSKRGKAGDGGKAAGQPRSCLDALWGLLQQRERLQKEQPAALAKLLQVLAAFWQSSGAAFRAVAVLQRQPGLWLLLTGVLKDASKAPPPAPQQAEEAGESFGWVAAAPSAALLSAEACSLQILAAECYAWAASASGGASSTVPPGMPADLATFLRSLPTSLLPQLLRRYAAPQPTAAVLMSAQRAAAAGGLQLLGVGLADEALWRSMGEGSSLLPSLATSAAPLLRQFSSNAEAAGVLAQQAQQLAAANFPHKPAAVALARLVMQQVEVPERVAADRELGAAFVYDSQLLQRRLGSVLVQQLGALQGLSGWLEAASVAASLEDAKLAAVTALKALLSVAHKHRLGASLASGGGSTSASTSASAADGGGQVPAEAVQSVLDVLRDALADLGAGLTTGVGEATAAEAAAAAAAAEATAVDPSGVHLLNAAEAAYILLLLAQRWAAAGSGGQGPACDLCAGVLQATGQWLEVLEGQDVTSLSPSPDAPPAAAAVTGSLLAAALVLLPLAPSAAAAAGSLPSQAQQRLQAVATQLLPLLLASCRRQPPHLVLVVSLAAGLIDKLVPSAAWLPLVRSQIHFGDLLHSMLGSLHSAAQQAAAARQAGKSQSLALTANGVGAAAAALLPLPATSAGGSGGGSLQQQSQHQQQQQQQHHHQQAQEQAAELGPLAAASVEEASLLLALQVAQARSGAELLVEQGAVTHALALGKWLLAAEGGNLMGETPQQRGGHGGGKAGASSRTHHRHFTPSSAPSGGTSVVVDYSNAYLQDGSPNLAHRLWCCLLSLLGMLLATLPGHAEVEEAALRLAVEAEPRLLLAAEPPAAGPQQPLTLAMAQEAKYTSFFICALARLSGQWRLRLPHSLPSFRRATASFLDFAASPGRQAVSCGAVSPAERMAARTAGTAGAAGAAGALAGTAGAAGALQLSKGWFGVAAAGACGTRSNGGGTAGAVAAQGGYAWQLAERLYSSAQYGLAFQLAVAPEVGEEELTDLGPEWVHPATLLALQEDVLEVAAECLTEGQSGSLWRLRRTLQALLGLSSEMQDSMGAERAHHHKQAVATAIRNLAAAG